MARSPYLEAQVNRWCKEKKELVIEDCDLATFNIIVDYMYGIAIPDSVQINATANTEEESVSPAKNRKVELKQNIERLVNLLEMSDRLLMVDLKDEVEGLLVKEVEGLITSKLVGGRAFKSLSWLAEKLRCDKLVAACVKYIAYRAKRGDFDDQKSAVSSFCTQTAERSPKFAAALLTALILPDQNA